tara:strand:- start:289 stop:1398 length:1110 start_codon:yes stop_codon:yes gene_type:complete
LSTAIKYSGFTAIIYLFLSYILINIVDENKINNLSINSIKKILFKKVIGKYIIIFIITFLVNNPGVIVYPNGFIESIYFEINRMNVLKNQTSFLSISFIFGILKAISISMGISILFTFLFGALFSFKTKNNFSISLLGFIFFYSITIGAAFVPRYFVAISPLICIYSGLFVYVIREQLNRFRLLTFLIITSILILQLSNTYSALWQRYPDSRDLAKEWIKNNISTTKTIGYDYNSKEEGTTDGPAGLLHLWRYPLDEFIYKNWKVIDFLDKPDYLVVNSINTNRISNLYKAGLVDIENGFTINSIPIKKRYLIKRSRIPEPEILEFYYNLNINNLEEYKLIKMFVPKTNLFFVNIGYRSPTIRILKKTK